MCVCVCCWMIPQSRGWLTPSAGRRRHLRALSVQPNIQPTASMSWAPKGSVRRTTYIVWEDSKFRACMGCPTFLSASLLPKYCRCYLQHISEVLLSSTWSLRSHVEVAVTRTSQPRPNGTQRYNVYRPPHLKEFNVAWVDGTFFFPCCKSGHHIKRQ